MLSAPRKVALCALLFPSLILFTDWLVWHLQTTRGGGYNAINVTRIVVAPLKGSREEYYADGTSSVRCTRSLAPHASLQPCWWLERHRVVYDR